MLILAVYHEFSQVKKWINENLCTFKGFVHLELTGKLFFIKFYLEVRLRGQAACDALGLLYIISFSIFLKL